jgi:hypothetical protein
MFDAAWRAPATLQLYRPGRSITGTENRIAHRFCYHLFPSVLT